MTELSVQYGCSPATGDYGNLTVENLAAARLLFGGFSPTDSGVIYWLDPNYIFSVTTTAFNITNPVDGLLEPTEAGGIVSIDTGTAIVNGYLYFNDTVVAFDIDGNPGNAGATDIIALRWLAASQTVRLVRINGAAGMTAVLTQTATQWEIPIGEVELDLAGEFVTLVDVRKFAQTTLMPPLRTVRKFIPSQIDLLGSTPEFAEGGIGIILADGANATGIGNYVIDNDFVSDMFVEFLILSPNSGNMYSRQVITGANCGEAIVNISVGAFAAHPIIANVLNCVVRVSVPGVAAGQYLRLGFNRDGPDALDTVGADVVLVGFLVEYQGYDGVFI